MSDEYTIDAITSSKGIAIGKDAIAIGELIQNLSMPADPLPPIDPVFAAARLSQLPSDYVPAVADLPPGSRIAFSPNPLFTGREDDLKQLATLLKMQRSTLVSAGIGGIGKTSLAAEFAHRYGQFFAGGVFWINCALPEGIPSECVACGGPGGMRLLGFETLRFDQQLQRVQAEWQSSLPRLLIFDNCENPQLLRQYGPHSGACRVLITSRNPDWPPSLGVHVLPLESLPRQDSIALLRCFRASLSATEADSLAHAMGDLPLGLHLTGSFLQEYQDVGAAEYLKQLAQVALEHPALQGRAAQDSPTGRAMNLGRAFALSYDQLRDDDPIDMLARQLLARAAYFSPGEPFPRTLLLASLPIGSEPMAELERQDGLRRLLRLGLIEREDEHRLRLHRLLSSYARHSLTDAAALSAVQHVFISIADDTPDTGTEFERLQPFEAHLAYLTQQPQQDVSANAAQIQSYLGRIYEYSYRHDLALASYAAALVLYRGVGDRVGEANVLVALGDVQRFRKELDAAVASYAAALALYRGVGAKLGEANVQKALGDVQQFRDDRDAAVASYAAALALYRGVGNRVGEANVLRALGDVQQFRKELDAAVASYAAALALYRGVGDRRGKPTCWQPRVD